MMARRLSHRVVAMGFFPPSSDSWHPTHSSHKFTRATASGESSLHELMVIRRQQLTSTTGLERPTTKIRPPFQQPETASDLPEAGLQRLQLNARRFAS